MRRSPSHSGFAMTIAVMLVALVSVAALSLTMLLAADARRTRREADSAQVRQLLAAATISTLDRLQRGETLAESWELDLPAELKPALNVRVSPLPNSDGSNAQRIDAVVIVTRQPGGHVEARQTIVFSRANQRWQVADVRLGD